MLENMRLLNCERDKNIEEQTFIFVHSSKRNNNFQNLKQTSNKIAILILCLSDRVIYKQTNHENNFLVKYRPTAWKFVHKFQTYAETCVYTGSSVQNTTLLRSHYDSRQHLCSSTCCLLDRQVSESNTAAICAK
jgi:hypothetical protein